MCSVCYLKYRMSEVRTHFFSLFDELLYLISYHAISLYDISLFKDFIIYQVKTWGRMEL